MNFGQELEYIEFLNQTGETTKMDAVLKSSNGKAYIDLTASGSSISRESDLNEILSLCYYHKSNFILLNDQNLSEEFFNLHSGLAGAAMQKFANYQVKVAMHLPHNADKSERFKELMYEMSKSSHFRFYDNREAAENWLTS